MTSKQIARIAILAALAFVLRMTFSHLPNIQPISALFLLATLMMGYYEAILVMIISILLSSFLLGFGPWVFWQITAFIMIMTIWRFLLYPLTKKIKGPEIVFQSLFAALLAFSYGLIIDSCFAYLYSMPWWSYLLAGSVFNGLHAMSTFFFYPILLTIFRRVFNDKVF